MPARMRPTPEDALTASQILLDGLAQDAGISGLAGQLAQLHPHNSTFPGEMFLRLAADALDWCGASRAGPLAMARSGALDADLLAQRQFYGTDFTKPLLFLEDGSYYGSQATAMHLTGTQWGVMNETGSYPGQPWLWLYQLWYQVPGFSSSPNVDLIAIYLTGIATIGLLAVPFIPGLRDIPNWIPVHRLIWRSYYRSGRLAGGAAVPSPPQPRAPSEPPAHGAPAATDGTHSGT